MDAAKVPSCVTARHFKTLFFGSRQSPSESVPTMARAMPGCGRSSNAMGVSAPQGSSGNNASCVGAAQEALAAYGFFSLVMARHCSPQCVNLCRLAAVLRLRVFCRPFLLALHLYTRIPQPDRLSLSSHLQHRITPVQRAGPEGMFAFYVTNSKSI